MISAQVAPPNALVRVEDAGGAVIASPEGLRNSIIISTDSCVAIGCQNPQDGDTEITLGSVREVDPGGPPAFQGVLQTPTKRVAIRSVNLETMLELPVAKTTTDIRVWINHPSEPDKLRLIAQLAIFCGPTVRSLPSASEHCVRELGLSLVDARAAVERQ